MIDFETSSITTDGDRTIDSNGDPQPEERSECVPSITDPASLADRDGVDFEAVTFPHEDAEHCEADAAGRAIVGVTTDAGELLLWVHRETGHAILPDALVDPGEDWTTVTREQLDEMTATDLVVDDVERVREVEHVVESDGETVHQSTTHHVVFGASPARPPAERAEPSIDTCDDVWRADWYDSLPSDPDDFAEGTALADVRHFLD